MFNFACPAIPAIPAHPIAPADYKQDYDKSMMSY